VGERDCVGRLAGAARMGLAQMASSFSPAKPRRAQRGLPVTTLVQCRIRGSVGVLDAHGLGVAYQQQVHVRWRRVGCG